MQPSQPTTTLQALVNLKRPTLRLSPLTATAVEADESAPTHDPHEHGLEFEYDCDAPKCGIYLSVMLPHDHPDVPQSQSQTPSQSGFTRVLLFEHVVEGGFGRHLTLEEGCMLELGRYDRPAGSSNVNIATPAGASGAQGQPVLESRGTNDRKSRRFTTNFHFRKRGPALAVVDAPTAAAANPASSTPNIHDDAQKAEDAGVKVYIRLAALDAAGEPLASRNEQGTYLHVVRMTAPTTADEVRPWVVKVVKREATIGPHTFQLHEIYGLSAQSAAPAPPTAPVPAADAHTYPPAGAPAPVVRDDEPQSECLLCLSSPREVVLLPCRHLVACKECALNMVEFGAGGTIVQPEEEATGPGADGAGNAEVSPPPAEGGDPATGMRETLAAHLGGGSNAAPSTPTVPPGMQGRRKRKAKGWFCPVCRQRAFLIACLLIFQAHFIFRSVYLAFTDNDHPALRPREGGRQPRIDLDGRSGRGACGCPAGPGRAEACVYARRLPGVGRRRSTCLNGQCLDGDGMG